MMMQCPRCSTRWRVAAAAPVENPLFKCGRCHHLFRQFPGATPPAESAPAPSRKAQARASEPDTLEFIFPDRQSAELLVADEPKAAPEPATARAPIVVPAAEPVTEAAVAAAPIAPPAVVDHGGLAEETEVVAAPPAPPIETAASGADEPSELDEDVLADDAHEELDDEPELFAADDAADFVADDAGDDLGAAEDFGDVEEFGDGEDDDLDEDEEAAVEPPPVDAGRRVRVEDVMKVPSGFGTIMRAMGTIVTGFAALALMIRVAPERTSALLAHVPIAGKTFAHDRDLASKVELANVQGRFQRLRNARRVFVISGDARNNSGMTIERIEVAGALYGLGGGELDQKIVTTGNRTTLTDLSEAEIALLQRLDPVIALAPGETTPFLIVFLEPPREMREFSSRVLSVRPTRRASTPPAGPNRGSVG